MILESARVLTYLLRAYVHVLERKELFHMVYILFCYYTFEQIYVHFDVLSCIQDTLSSLALLAWWPLGRVRARAKVSCIQRFAGNFR